MKERMRWIDLAKGICMIAVILGHLGEPRVNFVYSFHLTVFFILSGYTLKNGAITKEWLKDKFRRLMTPYFITCFAVAGMDTLNQFLILKNQTIATITNLWFQSILRTFFASGAISKLGNVWMGQRIGAIWFLPAMFFALILVRFLRNKVHGLRWQMLIGIGIAGIGCASAVWLWLPFSIQSAMLATPFILVGCYIKEHQSLDKIKWWHLLMMLAVFLLGYYKNWDGLLFVNCRADDWFYTPLLAIVSSLLILGLCVRIQKCAPLEWLGRNSLTVLCVHLFELNTMHSYFKKICLGIGLPYNKTTLFFSEILFVVLITFLLTLWSRRKQKNEVIPQKTERNLPIDIMRAILIVSMIFGHVAIDPGLRRVIYSIHMMAFVMISGYFYKEDLPLGMQLKKSLKLLIPYGAFSAILLMMNPKAWDDILMGISFSKKWFNGFTSIGPVYFILLLFLVRLIYSLLRTKNEMLRTILVLGLVAVGLELGKHGLWLPWSLDCALVALAFFHLGFGMRKYKVLERCKEWPIFYFLFASLWAYLIHRGSMEIAIRNYGAFSITLVGVFAGFMVLYQLCSYLADHWPAWLSQIFSLIGKSTGWILVFHTLFGSEISSFLTERLDLWKANVAYLFAYTIAQVLIGVLINLLIDFCKKIKIKQVA